MTRWGKEAATTTKPTRHPDLEELPPLPDNFEMVFLEAAKRLQDLANDIKEQRSKSAMKHFGGSSNAAPSPSANAGGEEGKPEGPTRITIEVYIPAHRAGLVIGHHGESLKRIEKMSQCKVQFDQQFQSDKERRVIIVGLPEDVEEAKRLIAEKVEDPMSRFPTVQIRVPQTRVGLVIGRGGETIRELQEKSGARITVQPENQMDSWNSNERIVNVTGDEASIKRAQEMINDLISGQARSPGGGPLNTARNATTIKIPETSVGAVIGKRAETLRTLQNLSGCRIYVEPHSSSGSTERNVHLTGSPEQIAYAQQLIMERVTQNESAAAYYGAAYDTSAQPSVIYQNPAEFGGATTGGGGMPEGYDYSQYYNMYYAQQQAAGSLAPTGAGFQNMDPSQMQQQQQQQQQQYDYAAYAQYYQAYNAAAQQPNQ